MVVKEKWIKVLKSNDHFWAVRLPTVSDLAHRHWSTILTLHYNQRLLKVAMWLQTVLSLFFVRLYTCIIVNNIHKYPVKCLLTEKIQNKYFDHAFFVNFVIVYMKMIICHIPWLPWSRTQANHKGEVSIFFFFLVMSVVQIVTWKKSTIVSMEWRQSLFIETGWPVDFRPNHANLVQVLCQEPRTSKCESDCFFHLTSYSSCTLLFQTQCSLV